MTLRIEKATQGELLVFTLTGRIQEEQMAELRTVFHFASREQRIVLDLKEVKLVDLSAVRFLAQREAEGMRLMNCPPYIREWITREARSNGK